LALNAFNTVTYNNNHYYIKATTLSTTITQHNAFASFKIQNKSAYKILMIGVEPNVTNVLRILIRNITDGSRSLILFNDKVAMYLNMGIIQ
jgi:hypothetical protein